MTSQVAVPPDLAAPLRAAVRGYLAHLQVERGLAPNTLAAYRREEDRYWWHIPRWLSEEVDRRSVGTVLDIG